MKKQKYIIASVTILFLGTLFVSSYFSSLGGEKKIKNNSATVVSSVLDFFGFDQACTPVPIPEDSMVYIDDKNNTIGVTIPYRSDSSMCFAPDIQTSYSKAVVTPALGEPQDFTNPVTYTINQDGFIKSYVVTVKVNPLVTTINTCEDLQLMKYSLSEEYNLGQDIDCTGFNFSPVGDSSAPFAGSFDGNGYTISNLYINSYTEENAGLFGYTSNANISNLKLADVDIVGGASFGSLVGGGSGNIENVSVTGNLSATSSNSIIGGIAGNFSGSIKNTSFEGNIALIGDKTCVASQGFSFPCSQSSVVGGLIGSSRSSIDNSFFNGNVTSDAPYTGGLVGINSGAINNSYAIGVVSGGAYFYRLNSGTGNTDGYGYTGGLIGSWQSGLVSSSYFSGDVSFKDLPSSYYYSYCAGGLAGDGYGATFNNSFASTNFSCSGQCNNYGTEVGALGGCGRNIVMKDSAVFYTAKSILNYILPFSYGSTGRQVINTSVAPNRQYFFSANIPMGLWNKNIWGINPSINNNYPYLKSFNTQLEPQINYLNISNVVGMIDQNNNTISIQIPVLSSEITKLVPAIIFDGVSISPESDVAQDFTNPVVYTVTGSDGETREYTVSITNTINNISSCTDLQNIKNNPSVRYVLKNNIDCSDTENWNSGKGFTPISVFSGELYGEGYAIDNLYINRSTESNIGLFSNITNTGKVSDLGITNASVVGLSNVGILSGTAEGNIEKTYTTGSVEGGFQTAYDSWTGRVSNRYWSDIAYSADGTKLAVVGKRYYGTVILYPIYFSNDSGVTWTTSGPEKDWKNIALSADGTKIVATVANGQIYTSTDSGITWTARESNRNWIDITSSADGTKLAAVVNGEKIYTSTDSGVTWTARGSNRAWFGITSSTDGTKIVAVASGGQIYTSTDSGITWTARESNRQWRSITSSADGTKLAAVVYNGQIYTSTDSGVTWTARESNRDWRDITSSADGTKLAATVYNGQVYISIDSGINWTPTEAGGVWGSKWTKITSSADGKKFAVVGDDKFVFTTQQSVFPVGGLIGQQNSGKITDSYTQGEVVGYGAGGLVGKQTNTGTIVNSYWDTQTSGQTTSAGGEGKTTSQMKTPSTFIGWDTNIWNLVDGAYPTFKLKNVLDTSSCPFNQVLTTSDGCTSCGVDNDYLITSCGDKPTSNPCNSCSSPDRHLSVGAGCWYCVRTCGSLSGTEGMILDPVTNECGCPPGKTFDGYGSCVI